MRHQNNIVEVVHFFFCKIDQGEPIQPGFGALTVRVIPCQLRDRSNNGIGLVRPPGPSWTDLTGGAEQGLTTVLCVGSTLHVGSLF